MANPILRTLYESDDINCQVAGLSEFWAPAAGSGTHGFAADHHLLPWGRDQGCTTDDFPFMFDIDATLPPESDLAVPEQPPRVSDDDDVAVPHNYCSMDLCGAIAAGAQSSLGAAGYQMEFQSQVSQQDYCNQMSGSLVPEFHSPYPPAAGNWGNWGFQGNYPLQHAAEEPNNIMKVGKYSMEERKDRILRYLKKRNQRNFNKTIKYACRKTLADRRVRVRGRFARNKESYEDEVVIKHNGPQEKQSYLAESIQTKDDEVPEDWLQEAMASLGCLPYFSGGYGGADLL